MGQREINGGFGLKRNKNVIIEKNIIFVLITTSKEKS